MYSRSPRRAATGAAIVTAVLCGCSDSERPPTGIAPAAATANRSPGRVQCAPDNARLTLPSGFCAVVVADLTENGTAAPARHLAITPAGDIFVAINAPGN